MTDRPKINEWVRPILLLIAAGIKTRANYDEILEAIEDAYIMGLEDGRKGKERTTRTVENIMRDASHG